MKYLIFSVLLILTTVQGYSQNHTDFGEGQKLMVEGIEFGFTTTSEKLVQANEVEYLEITFDWYATNRDRFSKFFLLKDFRQSNDDGPDLTKRICIGKFQVRNAVGNKISAIVEDPNTIVNVVRTAFLFKKKNKIKAYNFQAGQTLTGSVTLRLPKEKKPDVVLQSFLSPAY